MIKALIVVVYALAFVALHYSTRLGVVCFFFGSLFLVAIGEHQHIRKLRTQNDR